MLRAVADRLRRNLIAKIELTCGRKSILGESRTGRLPLCFGQPSFSSRLHDSGNVVKSANIEANRDAIVGILLNTDERQRRYPVRNGPSTVGTEGQPPGAPGADDAERTWKREEPWIINAATGAVLRGIRFVAGYLEPIAEPLPKVHAWRIGVSARRRTALSPRLWPAFEERSLVVGFHGDGSEIKN